MTLEFLWRFLVHALQFSLLLFFVVVLRMGIARLPNLARDSVRFIDVVLNDGNEFVSSSIIGDIVCFWIYAAYNGAHVSDVNPI